MTKFYGRALALTLSAALYACLAQIPLVSATESEPVQTEYLDRGIVAVKTDSGVS